MIWLKVALALSLVLFGAPLSAAGMLVGLAVGFFRGGFERAEKLHHWLMHDDK